MSNPSKLIPGGRHAPRQLGAIGRRIADNFTMVPQTKIEGKDSVLRTEAAPGHTFQEAEATLRPRSFPTAGLKANESRAGVNHVNEVDEYG